MLVSNIFPIFGSVASFPLVTVCGVESSFSTAILSPALTVIGSGSYDGFPCTDAPCGIFRVAAAGVAAVAPAVDAVDTFDAAVDALVVVVAFSAPPPTPALLAFPGVEPVALLAAPAPAGPTVSVEVI